MRKPQARAMAIFASLGLVLFLESAQCQIDSMQTSVTLLQGNAEIALGFNYDYIRSPLDVSFDYPRGYFGINIPLKYTLPSGILGEQIDNLAENFNEVEQMVPDISAKQNANTSIIVDVPMLGGVASFSNIQMMHLRYANKLSIPRFETGTAAGSTGPINLFLRGVLSVPIDLSIGWETMTFGYAYKIDDNIMFALNLHRHVFNFDIKALINIDILGNYTVTIDSGGVKFSLPGTIDYSLHNAVQGHYEVETWTPTVGVQLWRFSLVSRFGMNTRPKGFLSAKYSVPFFLDPESFQPAEFTDKYLADNISSLQASSVNAMEYSTTERLVWKMPQAHTLQLDIFPKHLTLSYTKLFGSISMQLYDPLCDKQALIDTANKPDTLDFRFGAAVDHIIMLHGSLFSSFFNLGIYSMDYSFRDKEGLLSSQKALSALRYGNGIMAPVLNGGTMIGGKIKLLAELDILPLIALKGGVVYFF
ncbi:MAG: hypothetical protein JW795_05305 [Chitinivibrionales bacterium]|nr:hypothetical protein [Chitinivibrionales bacterium]